MEVSRDAARAAGGAPSNQQERSTGRPPDTGHTDAKPTEVMEASAGLGHAARRRSDAAPTLCYPVRDDELFGTADRASVRLGGRRLLLHRSGTGSPAVVFLPGAGLLLLDAFHEDWDAHMPAELRVQGQDNPAPAPELTPELLQQLRGVYEQKLADWPPELRELLIDRHLDLEWLRIDAQENTNLAELADALRQGGKVPDVPLISLTALAPILARGCSCPSSSCAS
jgi:hypothetical protein